MEKELYDYFREIYAHRLYKTLDDVSAELNCEPIDIKNDASLSDCPIDGAKELMKQVSNVGADLLEKNYNSVAVASALIMRAKLIMLESDSKEKCESFAEVLKLETENFKLIIPSYFDKEPLSNNKK